MNYRILPAAQQDLRHIDDWIAAQFGDAVADRARKRIYDIFDLLSRFPRMGIERPDVTDQRVRFFASPHNWIVYAPTEPIVIHRILSPRMESDRLAL